MPPQKKKNILSTFVNLVEEPIFLLSPQFVILDLNDSAQKIFKIKKRFILGKPFSVLCPNLDLETPHQATELISHIEDKTYLWRSLLLKNTINSDKFILVGTHADQKNVPNNKEIDNLLKKSTHDEVSNLNQLLTGQLVDKSKNVLDHVKNIYDYMENIISEMPVSVYWINKEGIYLGCNNNMAKLLNLKSRHNIIGKTYNDLYDEKSAMHYMQADRTVMKTGIPLTVEEPLYYPDGTKEIYLSNKVPLHNSKGEITGMVGISVDITGRKKMENDLHQAKIAAEAANHAKSEFIANISHDVRTPLTGIITFSRFLKEQDTLGKAERKELAGDTYHASEQLLNLLNSVLDVVSADSATDHDLNLKSFNLMQMIEDLIQLEKPAVKSHNLELRQAIDENLPKFVVSDKMKVHRILLNLIGNAIKFTENGYIKLSATLQAKDKVKATIVFSVEDTGIGIPEEAQPQIFERFYKVSSSYKGKYTGNGIGLNIVKTYLQLLGGQIDFHSTFGEGTTFFVTLTFPIGEAPKDETSDDPYKEMLKLEQEEIVLEEEAPVVETSIAVDNINSTIKILLVEDNFAALKALKILLMPFKLHVMEAKNAEDAFELVKKEAFDLIITDIGLPEMQGDELVAKIRQLEKETNRATGKIVALTGHAVGGELADNCKKAGTDDLFQKPMQPNILKSLIDPFIKKMHQPITESESEVTPEKKSPAKGGKLGIDLPDTEAQLFEIDQYPLLDLKIGAAALGSEDIAKDILKSLNEEGIAPELEKLQKAHKDEDWETIRALAHKIKGGATFGTVRLYYALLYTERYIKAGHRHCTEKLYTQMLRVIDETVDYLDKQL